VNNRVHGFQALFNALLPNISCICRETTQAIFGTVALQINKWFENCPEKLHIFYTHLQTFINV
jgi:hypothetical protein